MVQEHTYISALAETPTPLSTFLVSAIWLKVKVLESYKYQPEEPEVPESIQEKHKGTEDPVLSPWNQHLLWTQALASLAGRPSPFRGSEVSQRDEWESGTRG